MTQHRHFYRVFRSLFIGEVWHMRCHCGAFEFLGRRR